MSEPIENLYFNWLCAKVTHVKVPTPSNTHWKLLRKLHTTEYVFVLPNDKNRADDGVELRLDFLREARVRDEEPWHHEPCSVLEMLIAFAYRAAFQFDEVTPQEWFWLFLKNMGLADFVDSHYREGKATDILERFVWRTYASNGVGGSIFPMRDPPQDQRQVEIWYQLFDYMS